MTPRSLTLPAAVGTVTLELFNLVLPGSTALYNTVRHAGRHYYTKLQYKEWSSGTAEVNDAAFCFAFQSG